MRTNIKTGWILVLFLITGILSAQQAHKTFQLSGHEVKMYGDFGDFEVEISTYTETEGLEVAKIRLESSEEANPPEFVLKWSLASSNIAGYWSSGSFVNKTIGPDWYASKVRSMLAREAPVITLFGHDDTNRLTFSSSDVLNTVTSSTGIREEDGMVYNELKFLAEQHRKTRSYEVEVRFDTRPLKYSTALAEVAQWWAAMDNYTPVSVPEVARLPVYSTWYSYHQNVNVEDLLEECKLAKKMGFESIIVDDGWQTLDSNRGYAYTGDWLPERLPNMKEFVEAVHDLDMKFMLWYAVPFVGEKSKAYEKMKGKFLRYWEGQGTYVLDPRYPEVREFIINTYLTAVKEWNLDGFKLDFIARFSADENTELTAENGRDYASVNEATDVLMTNLMRSLQQIKPDIMIEFRQPYAGPAMRKYGNMFRAADCPNLASINRIRTSDLRLLSGNTAVHSDMLMWHYDETVENAALQLLNVMFSVPQISVRLADIPEEHFEMIRFYTAYWLENRDVLLDGEFYPEGPLTNYRLLEGWKDRKKIVAVFGDQVVSLNTQKNDQLDILNAKPSSEVAVRVTDAAASYSCSVYDCKGNKIKSETLELKAGIHLFEVPPSGLIALKKI